MEDKFSQTKPEFILGVDPSCAQFEKYNQIYATYTQSLNIYYNTVGLIDGAS